MRACTNLLLNDVFLVDWGIEVALEVVLPQLQLLAVVDDEVPLGVESVVVFKAESDIFVVFVGWDGEARQEDDLHWDLVEGGFEDH